MIKSRLHLAPIVFFFVVTAHADQKQIALVKELSGMYSLSADCSVDGLKRFEKARVSLGATDSGSKKTLSVMSYSAKHGRNNSFAVTLGQSASNSDGVKSSWQTKILEDGTLTSVVKFSRPPSSGFVYVRLDSETRIERIGADLKITVDRESETANGEISREQENCLLGSLKKDPDQIVLEEISKLKNASLEDLARGTPQKINLDQADMSAVRHQLNKTKPTQAQIKEALNLLILPLAGSTLKLRRFDATKDDSDKASKFAFRTALRIANEYIADGTEKKAHYKPLFDHVSEVEKFLAKLPAKVLAYQVEWSESDADGEGLLFIDTETGETLYVGSAYFS